MPEQKCTLSDKELIDMCNQWVHSLAKTGGQSWILQVPVNFNRDPDMLFIELGKRFETLQAENSKMRNALEELTNENNKLSAENHTLSEELGELQNINEGLMVKLALNSKRV